MGLVIQSKEQSQREIFNNEKMKERGREKKVEMDAAEMKIEMTMFHTYRDNATNYIQCANPAVKYKTLNVKCELRQKKDCFCFLDLVINYLHFNLHV